MDLADDSKDHQLSILILSSKAETDDDWILHWFLHSICSFSFHRSQRSQIWNIFSWIYNLGFLHWSRIDPDKIQLQELFD